MSDDERTTTTHDILKPVKFNPYALAYTEAFKRSGGDVTDLKMMLGAAQRMCS
jgi:hypothetical protein